MQMDTNHLVSLDGKTDDDLRELLRQGYQQLDDDLNHAANVALQGRDEVTISFTSGGKLSKHASKMRKQKKKDAYNSKKRNRR